MPKSLYQSIRKLKLVFYYKNFEFINVNILLGENNSDFKFENLLNSHEAQRDVFQSWVKWE